MGGAETLCTLEMITDANSRNTGRKENNIFGILKENFDLFNLVCGEALHIFFY